MQEETAGITPPHKLNMGITPPHKLNMGITPEWQRELTTTSGIKGTISF
jgi:hypothetical protein